MAGFQQAYVTGSHGQAEGRPSVAHVPIQGPWEARECQRWTAIPGL